MKITKEIKIAIVAIVGIMVMYFGINFLKGINLFSSNSAYYMTFDDIQGLGVSTPVYADGYKVGTVEDIDFDYDKKGPIKVTADLDKNLRIPAGSQAEIVKDLMGNLAGEPALGQQPTCSHRAGRDNPGVVNAGIMNQVGALMPDIQKMLAKLDSILTSVNTLLADRLWPPPCTMFRPSLQT